MASIGIPGLLLILFVVILLFGSKKLPELGRSVGQTMKEFKSSTKDLMDEHESKKE